MKALCTLDVGEVQASSTAVVRYPWTGLAVVRSVGNTTLATGTSVRLGQVVLRHVDSLLDVDLLEQGVVIHTEQTKQLIGISYWQT